MATNRQLFLKKCLLNLKKDEAAVRYVVNGREKFFKLKAVEKQESAEACK